MNNDPMVARWCPDTAAYDKKQYHKTGDGHVMALAAGAKMEPLGHTKMMHDFDSAQMYEELCGEHEICGRLTVDKFALLMKTKRFNESAFMMTMNQKIQKRKSKL